MLYFVQLYTICLFLLNFRHCEITHIYSYISLTSLYYILDKQFIFPFPYWWEFEDSFYLLTNNAVICIACTLEYSRTYIQKWNCQVIVYMRFFTIRNIVMRLYKILLQGRSKPLESESCSVVSNSLWPHGLYSPWNSPGQNTEWVAFPFSRVSSQPSDRTQVSHIRLPSIVQLVKNPPAMQQTPVQILAREDPLEKG